VKGGENIKLCIKQEKERVKEDKNCFVAGYLWRNENGYELR
jgi:hypothetical protein